MKSINKKIKRAKAVCWLFFLLCFTFSFTACKKFLDEKPNISDVIPTTLNDLQTLLDNAQGAMNSNGSGAYGELLADNFYVLPTTWQTFASSSILTNQSETQNYIWGNLPHDVYWSFPYTGPIYCSNIVLDQLPLVSTGPNEIEKYNNIRGAALFYRSFAFEGLAQLFCKPYAPENVNEPGIVLKLSSNVNQKISRATVQQTYDRIIADLMEAASLLPDITTIPPKLRTRPSKTAAYAALARTYLSMRDYVNAGLYANKALLQYNKLMSYDSLYDMVNNKARFNPPIQRLNDEVIFHSYSPSYVLLAPSTHKIDTLLYQSYNVNDLRKFVFFRPFGSAYFFQGSYNGTQNFASIFDGLATDELYLMRAECSARANNKTEAMDDLNYLLRTRWRKVGGVTTYVDQTASDPIDALNKVLAERRKELVFRGLRWSDVRRFNMEGANITLKRNIAGTVYSLPPNDPRSVMLISFSEIENNSNVLQNPR